MSLKPVTILRRARILITDPKRWIKGAFTRKRKGLQCYCGLGALAIAAGRKIQNSNTLADDSTPEYTEAHRLLALSADSNEWYPSFNDAKSTTHEMVLDAFDRAIAMAKG